MTNQITAREMRQKVNNSRASSICDTILADLKRKLNMREQLTVYRDITEEI